MKNVKYMFESARVKLTLFYLAIILALSLTLTFGTRWLAQRQFEASNVAQRGQIQGLFTRGPRPDYYTAPSLNAIRSVQQPHEAEVRQRLNDYVLYINLAALVIGSALSYWFASRTLKPLEEAHEAQKRFTADASHELRTPLTTIRTENEVFLRQKDFSKDEARGVIESNLEEVLRLEQLSSNLLALTQYEDADLELESLPIVDLIYSTSDALAKSHPGLAKRLKVTLQKGSILAHKDSAVQLLAIVLDNAAKYTPPKTPITVSGRAEEGHYSLVVDDLGSGINHDELPFIFDRLYRSDKARSKVPGYGLGLSLAKEIASANQATITAANNESGGARFVLRFQRGSEPAANTRLDQKAS